MPTRSRLTSVLFVCSILLLGTLIGCSDDVTKNSDKPTASSSFTAATTESRFAKPVFEEAAIENEVVFAENIELQSGKVDLKLDVYQPKGDTLSKRPTLFYIHGGGFRTGDKSDHVRISTDLAKSGYLVVAVNYRLYEFEESEFPKIRKADLEDIRGAVQWLLAHQEKYKADPHRIGFIGESAGGHLSFGAGYESQSFWEGVLEKKDIFAVVNMYGSFQAELASIDKDDPPMLIIHGDKDEWVPYQSSVELSKKVKQAGIRTELFTMTGEGHNYSGEYYDEVLKRSAAFFKASL